MNVEFNKKQYIIPDDLNEYLIVLDLAGKIQGNLSEAFMQKALSAQSKVVSPDEMNDAFKDAAERFIQRLCEKGVYDKTIDEYTFQNEGYLEFLNVTKNAMQAMVKFLSEQAQDYEKGRYEAEQKALSSVTGSGVSVYSSSILTLALTSAVEYTTLQGQCNKEDEQYAKELKQLRERGNSERERKENGYFATQYCPEATDALRQFAYCLMGRYLDDLIANNLFDKETLQYIDLKRSQEILKNLKVSPNKEAVLEKAFIACPFNFDVYVELGELGKLDMETFETAKVFGQSMSVKQQLYKAFENVSYKENLHDDLIPVENIITSLSLITGKEKIEFYKKFTDSVYTEVVNKYKKVQEYASNVDSCKELLENLNDKILDCTNTELLSIAEKTVGTIISDTEFDAIVEKGGHSDFLVMIFPERTECSKKHDADETYIKKIYENLVRVLPTQKEKFIKDKQEKAANKSKKLKKAQKEKAKSIVVSVLLLMIPFVIALSIGPLWEMSVKSSVRNYIQAKIDGKHSNGWGYWVNIGGIDGFEIEKMNYIKTDTAIYATPKIVYNVGSNSVTVSDAEWVIDDFYRDYWGSVPFYISFGCHYLHLWQGETIVRCPNGQEITIGQSSAEHIKKKGEKFSPIFPFPLIVIYGIYAVIVFTYRWMVVDYYSTQVKKYS